MERKNIFVNNLKQGGAGKKNIVFILRGKVNTSRAAQTI
jgi:hypothetical protein